MLHTGVAREPARCVGTNGRKVKLHPLIRRIAPPERKVMQRRHPVVVLPAVRVQVQGAAVVRVAWLLLLRRGAALRIRIHVAESVVINVDGVVLVLVWLPGRRWSGACPNTTRAVVFALSVPPPLGLDAQAAQQTPAEACDAGIRGFTPGLFIPGPWTGLRDRTRLWSHGAVDVIILWHHLWHSRRFDSLRISSGAACIIPQHLVRGGVSLCAAAPSVVGPSRSAPETK